MLEAVGDVGEGPSEVSEVRDVVLLAERRLAVRSGVPDSRQNLRQRLPLDVLHGIVGRVLVLAHCMDGDNVWMVQFAGGSGFAHEAVERLIVRRNSTGKDLERDASVHRPLPRLVHHPHAPAPDLPAERVVAESAKTRLRGVEDRCVDELFEEGE